MRLQKTIKLRYILIAFSFILLLTGCLKEDPPLQIVSANTTMEPSDQDVYNVSEWKIDYLGTRAGISLRPMFFKGSASVNYTLDSIPNNDQEAYNLKFIDSIKFLKTSPAYARTGNQQSGWINICNYDITLFLKNGRTIFFDDYLSEYYFKEKFTYIVDIRHNVFHVRNDVFNIKFKRVVPLSKKVKLPFINSSTYLWYWNVYDDGQLVNSDYFYPTNNVDYQYYIKNVR